LTDFKIVVFRGNGVRITFYLISTEENIGLKNQEHTYEYSKYDHYSFHLKDKQAYELKSSISIEIELLKN
jgi:hypothetical protein